MRLLVAIPHYFDPTARQGHGSLSDTAERRAAIVADCLATLRQHFGRPQCVIDIGRRTTTPSNFATAVHLDVALCTTDDHHLIDKIPLGDGYFQHVPRMSEPRLLGFECHRILRDRLGKYDYYCYMEDDLILRDPWFFVKLRWFTNQFGPDALLMPNRFEVARDRIVHKAYVDGPLRSEVTDEFQNVNDSPELKGEVLGEPVIFRRTSNPHSGCFFLTQEQMADWVAKPYFLNRDTRFVGPLESAATLGVMQTFRIYKPDAVNGAFLEIQHPGTAFLNLIRLPE